MHLVSRITCKRPSKRETAKQGDQNGPQAVHEKECGRIESEGQGGAGGGAQGRACKGPMGGGIKSVCEMNQ